MSGAALEAVFWSAGFLVLYHHLAFPLLARCLARMLRALRESAPAPVPVPADRRFLPHVTLIVPACNEEAFIRRKVENIAALDYPPHLLRLIVVSDGSDDRTAALARAALNDAPHLAAEVREYAANIGKTAVLNRAMEDAGTGIAVFSDVSSAVEADILKRFAVHFEDPEVGVVCGAYRLDAPMNAGERLYWDMQVALKRDENEIGAMMGAHGAFYAIRAELFEPLPADTINDDFTVPMRIVAKGYRTVYDTAIVVRELERTGARQDFARRVRISEGAMQQTVRLAGLLDPKRPGIAFVFASGKALRAFVPFLIVAMGIAAFALDGMGEGFYGLALAGFGVLMALGLLQLQDNLGCVPKIAHPLAYLAAGHMAGLIGGSHYLRRALVAASHAPKRDDAVCPDGPDMGFISPSARCAKRAFDVFAASFCFVGFIVLLPFVAIAIKLDSPGPVFYRQLRVGTRAKTWSKLFLLLKFRTMTWDAERETGAVWARRNDKRITRVGAFLRKMHLDELPQCLNVLRGDMSIVGPRPERPIFLARLEKEIPFYSERTYGLRPGMTGLAQITVGYDECVEDVRRKVLHDHVYATRLNRLLDWVRTDFSICFRTIAVVLHGKGR